MHPFWLFLELGFEHITDPQGYDHILFVVALAALYQYRQWKPLGIMVTAFTLGHSITLALTTLGAQLMSGTWIEFLIPVTIFIAAISNYFYKQPEAGVQTGLRAYRLQYGLAAFFGLIHGMGFSNYLRELMGSSRSILTELLAFNLGLEIGQLLIVSLVLVLNYIFVLRFNVKQREWVLLVSGAVAGPALILLLERWP